MALGSAQSTTTADDRSGDTCQVDRIDITDIRAVEDQYCYGG